MKVVLPEEMARIEKMAYSQGAKELDFMEAAGKGVALFIQKQFAKDQLVTLLCGKGNNAGDAFVAGRFLQEAGYKVQALLLFPLNECSPLCKLQASLFLGQIVDTFPTQGIILDGLLGTGFKGTLHSPLLEIINLANLSKLPIIAIDIPSGLNGINGEASPVSILATWTVFLGLPKRGFFYGDGWKYVGRLIYVDFGLSAECIALASSDLELLTLDEMKALLPPITRTRHKYQAGYVVGLAGSHDMPGAANLASKSALTAGAGIVRIWSKEENALLIPEIVRSYYNDEQGDLVLKSMNEASAVFVGPGLGNCTLLKELLSGLTKPVVIDADALNAIAKDDLCIPKNSVLTPHVGEMQRLLKMKDFDHKDVQAFVDKHEVYLVLKGAPTFIFGPQIKPFVSPTGDPGMATAGSGDVLTGIIAAFLAQKLTPLNASCLGVYFHGLVGEIAAKEKTSYALIASDLISVFPLAFKALF